MLKVALKPITGSPTPPAALLMVPSVKLPLSLKRPGYGPLATPFVTVKARTAVPSLWRVHVVVTEPWPALRHVNPEGGNAEHSAPRSSSWRLGGETWAWPEADDAIEVAKS